MGVRCRQLTCEKVISTLISTDALTTLTVTSVERRYFVVVPAGAAGFDADAGGGAGDTGFSQQAWTRAFRLSGAFGSMVPCRTTHRNVA